MNSPFANERFYLELQSSLASSTSEDRKKWAITINSENIPITSLAPLLSSGGKDLVLSSSKGASHFLWLVSDVAIQNPERFNAELPALFDFMEKNHPSYLSSFASWWHYCGVPVENEAKAIDYLFKWFLSEETAVYIKTRALWVLVELSKKYPELKVELKICVGLEMEKYSAEFRKRAVKILAELK